MALNVKVAYRNAKLELVAERVYSLEDYASMIKTDLLHLISDVEDLCYAANGNRVKEEWTDETWSSFCKIKHKILDKAGEIGRLPMNIVGDEPCHP